MQADHGLTGVVDLGFLTLCGSHLNRYMMIILVKVLTVIMYDPNQFAERFQ